MTSSVPTSSWRLVVVDATSGVPLAAGVINVAAALLAGFALTSTSFLPGWGDPLNACLSASFYLSPIATGSAAVHVGWLCRSGMADLADTAPDGRWRSLLVAAFATWLWSVASYGCLVAVVLLSVDLSGPWSAGMLLLPLQGTILVSVGVAFGLVVGATLPFVWTPPVVSAVIFIILNFLDRTSGPLDRFSMTFAYVFYQVNLIPNTTLLFGVMLTAIGVGALALLALRVSMRGRVPLIASTVVIGIFAAGVTTTYSAQPSDVDFRAGGDADCLRDSRVQLCVFAESGPQLAAMLAALVQARTAATPLFDVSREYRQRYVASPQIGPAPVDIPPNTERFGYLVRAVDAVVPGAGCLAFMLEREELVALVFERLQPGIVASAEVRDLATQPVADQRVWAASRIERLRSCR